MELFTDGQIVAAEMDGDWRLGLWRGVVILGDGSIAAKIQISPSKTVPVKKVKNALDVFSGIKGFDGSSEETKPHGRFRVGQRVSAWSVGAGKVYDGVVAKADPVQWCYHVIRDNGGGEYYTERDLAIAVEQANAISTVDEDDD